MELKLVDKHALVTGASGGIGLEITKLFLKEGSKVTACYRTQGNQLKELESQFSNQIHLAQVDVSRESSLKSVFDEAIASNGRVDIAVANAGIANHEGVGVQDLKSEQWNEIVTTNLTGAFLTAKYFFQNLEKHPRDDASLILVGSTAGIFGEAWYSDYSTSKAGMHGLMMSLKNEIVHLAVKGRVNIVNPGWTRTPMAAGAISDTGMITRILQTIPMRKIAEPRDIANVVLFLSSDTVAGHISGQTITVAGGMEGRLLFTPDEVEEHVNRLRSK